jgi:ketosteroid isomerase-like protein
MKFLTVLIASGLLAACAARSSDEDLVRALIDDMETAAEARDASDVLDLVADDYEDAQGFDRAQLGNFLRGYFLAHPKIELLVNIESLEFPADGLAQAEISVTSLALNDPDHARLKVEFRREGSNWKVRRADRVRP